MTNSTTPSLVTAPPTVPLARDPHGHAIPIPPEAAFWRVRRHTRGRPRNLTGTDRQPLRVPLDFTEADLDNMLGAGTYRLDLCDAAGEWLDVTTTVALGEPEPANTNDVEEPDGPSSLPALPAAANDIRLVLEANVRSTQMAFQHNERTLLASLRMADTLRDGIRDLATAQASWITSIASARGFFRNAPAAPIAQLTAGESSADSDDEGDDEEEEAERPPMGWLDMVQPVVATITETVVKTIIGKNTPAPESPAAASAATVAEPAKQGFELRELVDWRYAERKAKDNAAAQKAPSPQSVESAQAAQMLLAKGKEIFERVSTADRMRLVRLLPKLRERANDPALQDMVTKLAAMSPDEAAVWVSQHMDELEAKLA